MDPHSPPSLVLSAYLLPFSPIAAPRELWYAQAVIRRNQLMHYAPPLRTPVRRAAALRDSVTHRDVIRRSFARLLAFIVALALNSLLKWRKAQTRNTYEIFNVMFQVMMKQLIRKPRNQLFPYIPNIRKITKDEHWNNEKCLCLLLACPWRYF